MLNNTVSFHFNLTMFGDFGHYYYAAFVFCLLLYAFIVSANLVIILVITRERALHEPMYMLIACLSVNALYGSAGFFPRFLMDLLSDTHLISHPACFTQIYVIYTYAANELTILGIMAYDRYVAICHPLHCHKKMTFKTVIVLAALAWIYSSGIVTAAISSSSRISLCGNEIQKVFCASWNVVKLSCIPNLYSGAAGMLMTVTTVFLNLFYVLYTYVRIVIICWKSSSDFKSKVLHSCIPHIVSFTVYSITAFCDIALSRYDPEQINPIFAVILSLEFVVIPPILNPLVYGLKLPEIKRHISKMLTWHKII
ncbi:olfactory receptor 10A3-like [Sphaeramia orbicularis]|uniref:Olfactory receptor 10A3-like n=1 Tax=Sphaeramia orbicularis TaxID=375764 RepID=A0A673AXE6_9TELE|nr:olfactory receptor 10A3-like [Sphaeramia orbicularis]